MSPGPVLSSGLPRAMPDCMLDGNSAFFVSTRKSVCSKTTSVSRFRLTKNHILPRVQSKQQFAKQVCSGEFRDMWAIDHISDSGPRNDVRSAPASMAALWRVGCSSGGGSLGGGSLGGGSLGGVLAQNPRRANVQSAPEEARNTPSSPPSLRSMSNGERSLSSKGMGSISGGVLAKSQEQSVRADVTVAPMSSPAQRSVTKGERVLSSRGMGSGSGGVLAQSRGRSQRRWRRRPRRPRDADRMCVPLQEEAVECEEYEGALSSNESFEHLSGVSDRASVREQRDGTGNMTSLLPSSERLHGGNYFDSSNQTVRARSPNGSAILEHGEIRRIKGRAAHKKPKSFLPGTRHANGSAASQFNNAYFSMYKNWPANQNGASAETSRTRDGDTRSSSTLRGSSSGTAENNGPTGQERGEDSGSNSSLFDSLEKVASGFFDQWLPMWKKGKRLDGANKKRLARSEKIHQLLSQKREGVEGLHPFVSKPMADPGFRDGSIRVVRANWSPLRYIGDLYVVVLRLSPVPFTLAVFAAPILLSITFTCLYLLDLRGLYMEESVSEFFHLLRGIKGETLADVAKGPLDPYLLFQLFMFSLSLSTGLEPSVSPNSIYSLSIANFNALSAQMLFVFLSGAVFSRLSQPNNPINCAEIAVITKELQDPVLNPSNMLQRCRMLLMRYMIVGLDPCHLVDVRIQVTLVYDSMTQSGSFFRVKETLSLVKDEDFSQMYGFVVRHVIDKTSPLYNQTQQDLERMDASLILSVLGIEESSMQTVCRTYFYHFADNDIKWDAEFEDSLLEDANYKKVIDESRLSSWRYSDD